MLYAEQFNYENQYINLLRSLVEGTEGEFRMDRTGTGAYSTFGRQLVHDFSFGFPLLTTKAVHLKSIIHELLWIISGDTNIKYLNDNGVTIWDEWADENGDLGPVYGKQWRNISVERRIPGTGEDNSVPQYDRHTVDQLFDLVNGLKDNPYGRRHVLSAWNPVEIPEMKLPPCHCLFQCFVRKPQGAPTLDLQLYQRSADIFLGVPFNVASYGLLQLVLCYQLGYKPGRFIHTFGDVHLYVNHVNQAHIQINRTILDCPTMTIQDRGQSVFGLRYEDFWLSGYNPYPAIPAPVAV